MELNNDMTHDNRANVFLALPCAIVGGVIGAALAISIGPIAQSAGAQTDTSQIISGREIRLTDQQGNVRAMLTVLQDGTAALIFSREDQLLPLAATKMHEPLFLGDDDDKLLVIGLGSTGQVYFKHDVSDHAVRPSLYLDWLSSTGLFLVDPSSTLNYASLGWHGDQPALRMWDKKRGGLIRTVLAADEDGEPSLQFFNKNGDLSVFLGIDRQGQPNLAFFDANGKPVWAAR